MMSRPLTSPSQPSAAGKASCAALLQQCPYFGSTSSHLGSQPADSHALGAMRTSPYTSLSSRGSLNGRPSSRVMWCEICRRSRAWHAISVSHPLFCAHGCSMPCSSARTHKYWPTRSATLTALVNATGPVRFRMRDTYSCSLSTRFLQAEVVCNVRFAASLTNIRHQPSASQRTWDIELRPPWLLTPLPRRRTPM